MSSSDTNPAARPRARRGSLNRDVIVAAASALVDAEGLNAFTTRRLAGELGVRPMALYTHFPDKDAILSAVAEDLFARFEIPEGAGSDVELLADIMRGYFRLLVDHPVLLELDRLLDDSSEVDAPFAEAIYACLRRLRVEPRAAVGLVATLVRFVVGSAKLYQTRRTWDEEPGYWERQRATLAGLSARTYPALRALTEDFPVFSQLEVFEFGLSALLVAVEAAAGD